MKLIILSLIFILTVSGDSSSEMLSQREKQFLVFALRANEENLIDLLNCTSDPLDRNCVQRKLFTEITNENLLKIIRVRAFIFLFYIDFITNSNKSFKFISFYSCRIPRRIGEIFRLIN